ncbi:MAG: BamA/TamA family outer membrane protein [Myxococcota bacterium]|nr:BamA/TamA family outer membrane protein [Myxococcota bacterium]
MSTRVSLHCRAEAIALCLILTLMMSLSLASTARAEGDEERQGPRLPDPTYLLEDIEIIGDIKTTRSVVSDLLALELEQEVNVAVLNEARLRLLASGLFETAQFGLEAGSKRGFVVLVVTLEERNSILLSDLFLGSSARSPFWGGFGLVEGNFFGTGHSARMAFVASDEQFAIELGYQVPKLFSTDFSFGVHLHSSASTEWAHPLVARPELGREPFELDTVRLASRLSFGYAFSSAFSLFLDLRNDYLDSSSPFPELTHKLLHNGQSVLSSAILASELDTRDDPIMPRRGLRWHASVEGSSADFLSNYDFLKLLTQLHLAWEFVPGHVLRGFAMAGGIFGDAPYFDRFFVGDFDDLIPSRSLGLNFSARAPIDFFNSGADQLSYETILLAVACEYAIPLLERIDWIYRMEFFVSAGLFAATTPADERSEVQLGLLPSHGPRGAFPFDLSANLGLRVETPIGIFGLSFANALSLIPF